MSEQVMTVTEPRVSPSKSSSLKYPSSLTSMPTGAVPCRMMAPLLDALAEKFAGRVKFVKVNVEEASSIAAAYGISDVPDAALHQGRSARGRNRRAGLAIATNFDAFAPAPPSKIWRKPDVVIKIVIGMAAGSAAGALLGATRSCGDGGCPLTANPLRGALWGGLMGLFAALAITGG